ncbi:ABC transporter substrate-binding protein [uncultured Sphaerochaeta sp.]|uniref:ABC transporter substrate-binding protein n=1 Tax=uncultured Sphaerochaeta sp. TaxID=886478 RepID=UPI0029C9F2BA|nr:ABC transporter substrate-binding protein [uncultured Sphaerochaeta sp.]
MKLYKWIVPLLMVLLISCGTKVDSSQAGNEMTVVALSSSLAELWILSGGDVAATTNDAFQEHPIDVGDNCINLGTVKDPSIELILSINPDLVLLSPLLPSHQGIKRQLESFQIECKAFDLDTLELYLKALRWCSEITGNNDKYRTHGKEIATRTQSIISSFSPPQGERVLLLRAHSTKIKALDERSLVGAMLRDLDIDTLCDQYPSLLDQLSWEIILKEDPTLILIVPMGNVSVAEAQVQTLIRDNPILCEVQAIKTDNVQLLPKALFGYKPNDRWDESYAYLTSLF